MRKIIAAILAALCIKGAVAVGENLLKTSDGNIWEVKDELTINKNYIVLFDTLGDDIVENDEIIRVWRYK